MSKVMTPLKPKHRVRHAEFGLGVVLATEGRRVRVRFDTGGTGMFSEQSAPLQRVRWATGDRVLVRSQEAVGVVMAAGPYGEVLAYRVQLLDTSLVGTVEESDIADAPAPLEPDERLAGQQFDLPKPFYFRTMGHYLACARHQLGAGSIAARIELKPHQIFVAQRVLEAPRPRFLLADEVGLGKTIEAGLILQELRARGALDRVLVVVPTTLTVQWLYELRQKFNERFKLYDAARVRRELAEHPGENIWELGRCIICPQSLLAANPQLWDDILAVPWDMVVFDEAHHIRRQQGGHTKLYAFAERLSKITRGLLLLTATPMQLHPYDLFSLVELLDPTLFYSYEYFDAQRERNKVLNAAMQQVLEAERLDDEGRRALAGGLRDVLGSGETAARALVEQARTSQQARDQILDRLAGKHLLSEVMIRNRKRVIGGFTRRVPRIIPVELSEAERRLYDAVIAYVRAAYERLDERQRAFLGFVLIAYQKRLTSSLHAFRVSVERRLEKLAARQVAPLRSVPVDYVDDDLDNVMSRYGERVALGEAGEARDAEVDALRELLRQARAIETDAKYRALERALEEIFRQQSDEQVLIFTQFVDTIDYLLEHLAQRWPTVTFHGRMKSKDKDTAIGAFARGDARILLSSEAGGEGRNLQFCSILINSSFR